MLGINPITCSLLLLANLHHVTLLSCTFFDNHQAVFVEQILIIVDAHSKHLKVIPITESEKTACNENKNTWDSL